MANRYWVGGTGTWDTTTTTHWSAASALSFTASCTGTALTTVGSPALVAGMTVWAANDTSLGTIVSGAGNAWVVSVGGTFASQTMKAATTGASVPTSADNVFFDANSSGTGSYTITVTGALNCLDFTNSAGTFNLSTGTTPTLAVAGSMTLNSTANWNTSMAVTFTSTTTGRTVTTNGVTLPTGAVFNGVGGGWTLGSAFSTSATGAITINAGTLDTSSVNNYSITAGSIVATTASTAQLNLNASVVNLADTTPLNISGPGFTLNAGTSQINITSTSTFTFNGSGKTFYNVSFTGVVITLGVTKTISGANTFNNLAFTSPSFSIGIVSGVQFSANQTVNGTFTGSGSAAIQRIFYSSDTLGTTRTITLANPATISNCDFRDITAATSAITATTGGGNCGGNTNITFPVAKTVYWNLAGAQNWTATGWATSSGGTPAAANFPLTQDTAVFDNTGSVTGTITIPGAYNLGTVDMSARTSAMTLATGSQAPSVYGNWLNGTGTTLTGTNTITFTARGGTQQITSNGVSFTQPITITNIGGTIQLQDAMTVGSTRTVTLTNGTLDLNGKTLTCGLFSSLNTNTRTIAFGVGNITVNGTGTIWNVTSVTGLTVTGTPVVNVSNNTATATTVNSGALSEANSISFNFTTGTYTLTFLGTSSYTARNIDFTGFAGTWGATSTATIYGNLTLSTGMTLTAAASTLTFAATSGTKTIASNGKTIDFPLTFNGVGGTWQLQDALTMGSTRTLTHTNGTIDLNGKTLTVGTAYTTAAGTKNLTFNAGTLVCPTASTTAFNNAQPTNYTTTAGTGVGYISMTGATAKTFVGGGSTFNCTLQQAGAGALTITGSNTFTAISNSVQPTTFTFTASTTQTVTNWSVSGTSGNLVTINSSTAGTRATLSKSSGTVSSDYLSIQDSAATGGATWYAGANSTNVSNNTGWIFTAPPGGNNFFSFLTN